MKKEDFFGGGYKVIIKGKEYPEPVCFLPDDPHELQAFLDATAEKKEPPNNKTSIIASMRVKGHHVVRFHIDCGIEQLKILNLIKHTDNTFFGFSIIPNYSKAKVKNGVVIFE